MISFFNKLKQPSYWKQYIASFKQKQPKSFATTRFVVFDTETTGLSVKEDRILSIGAVAINNGVIDVNDSFEIYLKQETFKPETVEIHGILKEGSLTKVSENKAMEAFLKYIKNAVLVAHHAAFDIAIIEASLKRMKLGKLKNRHIDTGILYKKLAGKKEAHFNLDKLSKEFGIPQHDRHTAAGDAFITALLFLKIRAKLEQERTVHFSDLFRTNTQKGLL